MWASFLIEGLPLCMKMKYLLLLIIPLSLFSSEHEAITRPCSDVTIAFVRSGLITSVNIKQGEFIQKGLLLAELDSELERVRVEQLESEVTNPIKIANEELKLEFLKKDLKQLEAAIAEGAATERERDQANLALKESQNTIKQLEFERDQMKKRLDEASIMLKQTQLRSPLDGYVEKLVIEEGESIERLKPAVQLVNIDPLWIEVPLPLNDAHNLLLNSKVQVRFPEKQGEQKTLTGKVIYKASVADASSETLMFRIEVPNSNKRLAGERVQVILPDND